MIAFDEAGVRRAVARFRRARCLEDTTVTVIARLDRAIAIAELKGPDPRWRTIPYWSPGDDPGDPPPGHEFKIATSDISQTILDRVLDVGGRRTDARAVLSASRWARFSLAARDAHEDGLGWLVPVHDELLLVPMPAVRTAHTSAGRPDVLHDDTGRPALEWMDGTVGYYLHGVEFDSRTYARIVGGDMSANEVAELPVSDARDIALDYLRGPVRIHRKPRYV